MNFFDRFKGNNLELKGPNLDSAKVYIVDLSGTKLTFPAPKQTALMPGQIQRFEFDLNNPDEFTPWNDSENMGFTIHKNGWEFTGEKKRSFGYVKLIISISKFNSAPKNSSFFSKSIAIKSLLDNIEADWGFRNKETIRELEEEAMGQSFEKYLFKYPKEKKELSYLQELNAIYYSIFEPGCGIETQYQIPLENQTWLTFKFEQESLDCDFFSPEHNFPEASEKMVKEFMNKVKVELSPEAESEKRSVSNN